jgi:hypothetical protein
MAQSTRLGVRVLAVAVSVGGLVVTTKVIAPPAVVQATGTRAGSIVPGSPESPTATMPPVFTSITDPTSIAVSVPAIALVKVDRLGRVLAAMTNTGRAPRTGDELWLVLPDGSIEAASPVEASGLANYRWVGDFGSPGVFIAQSREV